MAGLLGGDQSQLNLDAGGSSGILQGKLEEVDLSSTNWYFPREELERSSPSLRDGIDTRRETYFRKSYCTFLQDLGMRLKVPQVTIATAITFCHRFYLRQSHARNDRFMIATVCMFLAGKVEETPRVLKDVIIVSYTIRNKKDPTAVHRIKQKELYEAQKELVLFGERLLLTILGFELNIHHPYKPLVAAIKKFNVAQHALAQVAWNFVNDGLRTSLCLQFKPHHIAAGAIFLAAKFLKVKLPSDGERPWWQEFDVTPRQLEEVSNQMLELYEQNRAAPTSRSDPNTQDEPNGSDSVVPMSNGHHQSVAQSSVDNNNTTTNNTITRSGEFEARDSIALEPDKRPAMNGYDSRNRADSSDKRRASAPPPAPPPEPAEATAVPQHARTPPDEHQQQQQQQSKDVESGSEAVEQQQQRVQQEGKRKRESMERKWSSSKEKAEEGELPPLRGDDHHHSSSKSGGEKRYDSHDRDSHSRRDDYRRDHGDHHSYHYPRDGDRSRNYSKDREWQERDRDSKKSRHRYS